MKILTVNAGSSSLKFSLFELPEEKELINGYFERIGVGGSFYTLKINGEKIVKEIEMDTHLEAIEIVKQELIERGIVASLDEIEGVGHRVVHGGSYYAKSEIITPELIANVEKCIDLAPLHNPANITGITAFQSALPNAINVAIFDTAFHQTMDKVQYMYPVPYEWYENYGVRKYGFHGTSHRFIDLAVSEALNRDDLKIISCHLGSGASICAIDSHKSVDTSMGFTPLPGVMMCTRSGDIDPSIIPFIMEKENKPVSKVMDDLNKRSGLLGVSGVSNDNRDIEAGIKEGNERCALAQDMLVKTVANYIAMYNNILGGADAICFTAGIGENGIMQRKLIIDKVKSLGAKIDDERNNVRGKFCLISSDDSTIPVYTLPTNEELMIARDTYELTQ
jgi:acetate kinase